MFRPVKIGLPDIDVQPLLGRANVGNALLVLLIPIPAVLVAWLLFIWFRGRQATPGTGVDVAEAPAGQAPAAESPPPSTGAAAPPAPRPLRYEALSRARRVPPSACRTKTYDLRAAPVLTVVLELMG